MAQEYQASKIRSIVQIAANLIKNEPYLAGDPDYLWMAVVDKVAGLEDPAKCGGCDRSMKITVYEADLHDGLLIYTMAKAVREQLYKGVPFTEANKVHIPTLSASNATLKRQTKCDYLGLVKQPEAWRGSGYWVLTGWAWKALRGEQIPKAAKYWEGRMLGRSTEMTTLDQMFKTHTDLVARAIEMRKQVKADHRNIYSDYKPHEWVELGERAIAFEAGKGQLELGV